MMARSEARLSVSIWTDPDFLALTPGAQRMFMFLLSQPDLAHDGVIALRVRRWSTTAKTLTRVHIERDLDELHATRFVVVDWDAEELLVRSFIRRDKVYRQPNVLRAAADHLAVVTSPAIRWALAVELERIAGLDEKLPTDSPKIIAEMRAALPDPTRNPPPNPSRNPSEAREEPPAEPTPEPVPAAPEPVTAVTAEVVIEPPLTDISPGNKGSANPTANPSAGTPGERGGLRPYVGDSPFPGPPSPYPVGAPSGAAHAPPGTDVEPANTRDILGAWIDHCAARGVKLPTRVKGHYAKRIKAALDDGFDDPTIRRALGQLLDQGDAGRPSLLDAKLIDVQSGPRRRPKRLTPGEEGVQRMLDQSEDGAQVIELFYDALGVGERGTA